MHFEVPDCVRCCFCIPLRHGILIFGYLNLIFSIFVISLELWLDIRYSPVSHTMTLYRGIEMYTQLWLPYVLYTFEIIFNILLIIGAHLKQTKLMKAYYYYGIITTVATLLIFIVIRTQYRWKSYYLNGFEVCLAFSGFVLQVYLLLIVRSELQKLKYQQGQFSFVNHMVEVMVEPINFGEGRNPL